MTEDEQIERLVKRATLIMYKNPSIFPIVEEIFISAKHYKVPKNKYEFYVRQTLETRVGLYFVVKTKYASMSDLRYISDYDFLQKLEKEILKSSILIYGKQFPDRKDVIKYKKMLAKENLN